MDDLLTVLNQQLQEQRPKLLFDRRVAAYKFLDKAYLYTSRLHDTDEPLDPWESKLVFALNYALDLPKDSDRDQLRTEIAYAKDVFNQRIDSNPAPTSREQRVFEIVEQFSLVGDLA